MLYYHCDPVPPRSTHDDDGDSDANATDDDNRGRIYLIFFILIHSYPALKDRLSAVDDPVRGNRNSPTRINVFW